MRSESDRPQRACKHLESKGGCLLVVALIAALFLLQFDALGTKPTLKRNFRSNFSLRCDVQRFRGACRFRRLDIC